MATAYGTIKQTVLEDDGTTREQTVNVPTERKKIAGGFSMIYKDPLYDFIETLTPAQFRLYRLLEQMILSGAGKEIKVVGVDIARSDTVTIDMQKGTKHSKPVVVDSPTNDPKQVSKILTHMVKYNMIMETKPKHYLFNPYILLPTFSDGELLQREWNNIIEEGKFRRRGRSIMDNYFEHKEATGNKGLTFLLFTKEAGFKVEPKIIVKENKDGR